MNRGLVLTLDCGTQSVRALLFDSTGRLLAKEKVAFEPYFSKHPGWAEQDPEVYWESACSACKRLKKDNPELWSRIICLTVTTQRDTCINLDKDGNILRPAILWLDQRMAKCDTPLKSLDRLAYKAVGMEKTIEVVRKKSKANWLRENEPEIWNKTHKFIMVSGYFIYKLTGQFKDSAASQIGHIPFDYRKICWPKSDRHSKWAIFGIERDKLPELVEPGQPIGKITGKASADTGIPEGLPVISGASDKGCETLGMGCLSPECASISFGTTATIQTTSKKYVEPITFMPSYAAAIPGYYNPEVEIFRGYWMISWFKKEFCAKEVIEAEKQGIAPEELLDKKLADVPPGCHGLILQPYWGAGLKTPEAKGAIIGFGDVHTRIHIYRAIIEGINFALMEGLEKIEKSTGQKVKSVMVSGGGSQSNMICSITSDMFNLPVYRGLTHETSGLGAAIIGFTGMGIYQSFDEAINNMVHYEQVFHPDAKNTEVYRWLYENAYKNIYPKLRPIYKSMESINI
jgi:sugar (pentulose or hexulose) kinase